MLRCGEVEIHVTYTQQHVLACVRSTSEGMHERLLAGDF